MTSVIVGRVVAKSFFCLENPVCVCLCLARVLDALNTFATVSIERNLLKSTERKFGEKSVYRRARSCRCLPKDLAVFAFSVFLALVTASRVERMEGPRRVYDVFRKFRLLLRIRV